MNKSVASRKSGKSQNRKTVTKGENKENINQDAQTEKGYDYEQPSDLISPEELRNLNAIEKKIFQKKCEVEMFEYKQREEVYNAKRQELFEIEAAYRYLQEKYDESLRGPWIERKKTQELMLESLAGQKDDFKRKLKQLDAANNDMMDKLDNLQQAIEVRGREKKDL